MSDTFTLQYRVAPGTWRNPTFVLAYPSLEAAHDALIRSDQDGVPDYVNMRILRNGKPVPRKEYAR